MSLEIKDVEFGEFRLVRGEKTLLRNGSPVPITPKTFQLLVVLVENQGHLLEKSELMEAVWPDSFVEENNLAFTIRLLRVALGDEHQNPRFIETVPKRGYRFIAAVTEVAEDTVPAAALVSRSGHSRLLTTVLVGVVGLCLLLGLTGWLLGTRFFSFASDTPLSFGQFHTEKFSTSGTVSHAAMSPDGRFAAFTDETGGKQSVWIRNLETSENIQIVPPGNEAYHGLVVSHDGGSVYFVRTPRTVKARSAIYRVSRTGGVPEKLIETAEGWISLSPDDRQISFVRCSYTEDEYCSLMIADADGRNERKLISRPRPVRIGDNQFSPDGRFIAFAHGNSENGGTDFRLSTINLAGEGETEISSRRFFEIKNLKWLAGGSAIMLSALETLDGKSRIWRVSLTDGSCVQQTDDAANYREISFDREASRMIAILSSNSYQLYLNSDGAARPLVGAREVTFAPDGKLIYSADDNDIWTVNRDGGEQHQLTSNPAKDFSAAASPDGRHIYFTSNRTGANQVWRMNADGSDQTQLSKQEGGYPVAVSPDGRWVYYESGIGKTLWRVAADGGGDVQVTSRKTFRPAVSPDGTMIAFFFQDREGNEHIKLGVMTIGDERMINVIDPPEHQVVPVITSWSPDSRSINFLSSSGSRNMIWNQPIDEAQPHLVADLGDQNVENFAFARDGRTFAYIKGDWLYNAVLIDGLK